MSVVYFAGYIPRTFSTIVAAQWVKSTEYIVLQPCIADERAADIPLYSEINGYLSWP